MSLRFHPKVGTVLVCDFTSGFKAPEMVKRRPVVVVSPRLRRRRDLCTIVPLSTTPPNPVEDFHCSVSTNPPFPAPYDADLHWVKSDMIATVGFHRLSAMYRKRMNDGARHYIYPIVSADELKAIRRCILAGLGIEVTDDRS